MKVRLTAVVLLWMGFFILQKMRNYFLYIVFAVSLLACGGRKPEKVDVISRDKIIEILTELEFNQALIKVKSTENDSIDGDALIRRVFDKHEIDEEYFNRSLEYYAVYPEQLEDIYERVIENQIRLQAELESGLMEEK